MDYEIRWLTVLGEQDVWDRCKIQGTMGRRVSDKRF